METNKPELHEPTLNGLSKISTPYQLFRLTSIVLTFCISAAMLYTSIQEFHSREPSPQIFTLTPKRMIEWRGIFTPVNVGIHILNYPTFDITKNNFIIDCIIWFEFDPALLSLKTIDKFSFEKGQILQKSEAETKLIDKKIFARYNLRVQFSSNVNHLYFPLDDHSIYLTLENKYVTPADVFLSSDLSKFTVADVFLAGWTIVDRLVRYGYAEAALDLNDDRKVVNYPKIIYTIKFKRSGVRLIAIIFIPLLLFFFMSIASLYFEPQTHRRTITALASGSFTGIISYRFVIENLSPKVGYYMLSDHIYNVVLIAISSIFGFSLVIVKLNVMTPSIRFLRHLIFFGIQVVFLGSFYYLLFQWVE